MSEHIRSQEGSCDLVGMGPLTGADLLSWFNRHDLSVSEAARRLGCARSTVRYWIHRDGWREVLSARMEKALVEAWNG